MKGYITALGLSLLLGAAGAATAAQAVLDLGDLTKSVDATLVTTNADGKVTPVTRGTIKGMQTGGTSGNPYLYVAVKAGLLGTATVAYARVYFIDEGTGTFEVEYNGYDVDATTGDKTDNPMRLANPPQKAKFDTKALTFQDFIMTNVKLQGSLDGKADLRINDGGAEPVIVTKIVISDLDPRKQHFPHVDPAHPITIDGVIDKNEWDGALVFTMDKAEFDAANGVNWTGPADYSGTYSFKWDETALYILGVVTDATPLDNDKEGPDNYWQGDGLELYIGLDQSNPNRTDYLKDTDFQLITALGPTPRRAIHHANTGLPVDDLGPVPPADISVVKMDDKGYMFEYRVLWSILKPGFTPKLGQDIGFNMFGNNGHGSPSGQDTAMSPFKGKNMWKDPSVWVSATLEPGLTVTNPPNAGN